jgi:hypothetical protein
MTADDHDEPIWRKSSLSGSGNCVEVRVRPDGVDVRNSKDPDGQLLSFTHREWDVFIDGVTAGEFRPSRR